MIVPMRHVTVLCAVATREATVERLRALGMLHVAQATIDTPHLHDAQTRVQEADQALNLLDATARAHKARHTGTVLVLTAHDILARGREHAELDIERGQVAREIEGLAPFGDFDPGAVAALTTAGVPFTFFRAPHAHLPAARTGVVVRVLATRPDDCFGVQVGTSDLPAGAERVPVPSRRLAAAQARHEAIVARQDQLTRDLRSADRGILVAERDHLADARDFAAASEGMAAHGPVCWITGFCPADTLDALQAAARTAGWGWQARPPRADEAVPTLLRPPRLFRPVLALFDVLGIAPAYTEADISVSFYAFFTIFFAMLVGDAGYGLVLLTAVLLARCRFRRAPAAPFILLTVFACATIIWGVMTATYFGIPTGSLPVMLKHGVSRWLAVQSNIMQLCFTLGAVHLSLARLWSAAELFPDRKFLAQVGWVGVIWTMYTAACLIVVPGFRFPPFMFVVAGASILLIVLFMLARSELREKGIELAMLPLTIISCLGDVISYVRLFAVGLAGVKVAENFNEMSVALPLPLWAKIPIMLAILLLGHGLNLAMGALSILVHAVRLNTLEFSSHKGVSWSGFAYRPLRQRNTAETATRTAAF
jgi:V/A-type H+-transporting ATPase subunit I